MKCVRGIAPTQLTTLLLPIGYDTDENKIKFTVGNLLFAGLVLTAYGTTGIRPPRQVIQQTIPVSRKQESKPEKRRNGDPLPGRSHSFSKHPTSPSNPPGHCRYLKPIHLSYDRDLRLISNLSIPLGTRIF
jgi:hypothetical protein